MATKRYNTKTFDFVVNGEHVYFTCDTTKTKNGFCHHVFASGGGKYPDKHIYTDTPVAIDKYLEALKDAMAQAVVWYYTNIIERVKK